MSTSFVSRYRNSFVQFLKFGFIGGLGVFVNMAAFAVCKNIALHGFGIVQDNALINLFGTPFHVRAYHVYAVISFIVANLFNFVLNRYWTFREEQRAPLVKEYVPFLLVGSIAQGAGLLILTLLMNPTSPVYLGHPYFTDHGPTWTMRVYWAQLIQIILVMPINFVVNKLWTFRAVRRRHADTLV